MNAQYRKNLKAIATACKNYTDIKITELKWELGSQALDVESDTDTKYRKVVPANTIGCQINSLGGMSYKSNNLIVLQDVAETTIKGITYKVENGVITLNGTATADVYPNLPLETSLSLNGTYSFKPFSDGTISEARGLFLLEDTESGDYLSATSSVATGISLSKTYAYFRINISTGTSFTNFTMKPMLVSGSTVPTTFKQGFEGIRDSAVTSVTSKDSNNTTIDTLTIPSAVQQLTGYGWGINDTCYNYIDFENKKFVQKVGRVKAKDLTWYSDTTNRFYADIYNLISTVGVRDTNVLASEYKTATDGSNMTIFTFSFEGDLGHRVLIYDNRFNSYPTAFKNHFGDNDYIYYELAQVETDISTYLDGDTIEVESGGTITFTNTYSQDVPSDVDYLIEEVKA